LIREHFLENPHRVTHIVEPDPNFTQARESE
jgi:Zn-dependent M16 (insulinase) family peptidase